MLTIPRTKYPRRLHDRLRPRARATPTPPAVALNLVAAGYEEGLSVRLTFDRAVDVAGLDGNQITVEDGVISGGLWAALGTASLLSPETVEIELVEIGSTGVSAVLLDAGPDSGIVAANDGGTWAGVNGLSLPFP